MATRSERFGEIDALRGMAIVLMIIFHFFFDLDFLGFLKIGLYEGGWLVFQRITISLFLLLVGVSLYLSYSKMQNRDIWTVLKKFGKRSVVLFIVALGITLATGIAIPKGLVLFGVIHFIAAVFQAKACLAIRIQQTLPWTDGFADSPLQALQAGKGKAAHLATVLLAALRVHGIPSYISGDPNFLGPGRPHWWVEAYLPEGLTVLETSVEKRVLSESRRIKYPVRMLAERLRESRIPLGPTQHSSRLSKVENAPMAPEIALSEPSK